MTEEKIKEEASKYAALINEYGPIEEAFEDGAKWAFKQNSQEIKELKAYAQHHDNCPQVTYKLADRPKCTCGLEQALKT